MLFPELDIMKEKFAKLLLGEDMSGTGKGVASALALSNAVTNLAASVFGEHRKLEPMAPDTKERWKREVGWLLSVTDHIVEFVPTRQTAENGTTMEVGDHITSSFACLPYLAVSHVCVCLSASCSSHQHQQEQQHCPALACQKMALLGPDMLCDIATCCR